MKKGTSFIFIRILFVILLSLPFSSDSFADGILNVPERFQEHSNWCWDASSKANLEYYGIVVSQCAIANWAWTRTDCCGNTTFSWNHACNNGKNIYDIRDVHAHWGVNGNARTYALSQTTVTAEINAGRPFIMAFYWTAGGGHALSGRGIMGNNVYYMDPWPGNGYTISTYSWVVNGTGHSWGASLQITTNPTTYVPIGQAVDNTALTWTTGGNANWCGQTTVSYYGGDAAQSGTITHNGTSWVQATVSGPAALTFYWKVSSETSFDRLRFYINGSEQTYISGSVNWQQKSYSIPSGSNTIKWAYTKDASVSSGSDAGWIDKVEVGVPIGQAVDNTALTWTSGGNANWYGQNSTHYYGGDAAQSGTITHNGTSWVQTTMIGPGTLSYYWKVSSETSFDRLRFYINGSEQTYISGSVNWQQKSYSIPSGSNTIKWAYTKDASVSSGSDAGWLDRVVFNTPPCPDCPADGVITNATYPAGKTCSCSNATSITLGSNVTVESGAIVTFTAPRVTVQPGFHAENGSTVRIKQ